MCICNMFLPKPKHLFLNKFKANSRAYVFSNSRAYIFIFKPKDWGPKSQAKIPSHELTHNLDSYAMSIGQNKPRNIQCNIQA